MPTVLAHDVVERANDVLNDVLSARWGDDTLLNYLNEAQYAVVAARPDANAVNATMGCLPSAKQVLPAGGLRLIEVMSNTDTGKPVTLIDVDLLNEQVPEWRKVDPPVRAIDHYVYDDRDPKTFYVYPTPEQGHQIDLVYAAVPERVAGLGDTITVDDIYFNPLVDHMLWRAFSRDTANPAGASQASIHWQAFATALGLKVKADAAMSPNNG
ncbi:MAG: hypothetical protein CME59_22635 [Halioglobus sp.]|nr:hypothetical protein [Halioglobus sp.]